MNPWFAAIVFALVGCGASGAETTATIEQLQSSPLFGRDYVAIRLRYPGVYRVGFDELAQAGVPIDKIGETTRLMSDGKTVPFYLNRTENPVASSAQNYIEFVGDLPRGITTVRKPGNQENVYFLQWDLSDSQEISTQYKVVSTNSDNASTTASVRVSQTLEKDLYLSYTSLPPEVSDHYYWIKQSSATPGMYPLRMSFPGLSTIGELPTLQLSLVGLNENRNAKPGHLYDVSLSNATLGRVEFSGMTRHLWETTVPLEVARRTEKLLIEAPEERRNTPDMIALDYIVQTWPRTLDLNRQQLTHLTDDVITTNAEQPPAAIRLFNAPPSARVYCPERAALYLPDEKDKTKVSIAMAQTTGSLVVVGDQGWSKVDSVAFCPASQAIANIPADTQNLVIYHPDTAKAAAIYIDYRTGQNLVTHGYDITRIFDVMNNGYISGATLKQWLRLAYQCAPNLKYLTLLGDSTNDYREIHYEEREQGIEPHLTNNKVLIPIHWVRNPATRHSAGYPDDNWYGSFNWENSPDIAVGRIPVNSDEEAMQYLRKVFEYEQEQATAQDKLLLISSVENDFQDLCREAGTLLADNFTTQTEMFSEADMGNIVDVLDGGVQMVYYLGHGGSFVWRFGPTDYAKQKDLFTPTHVSQLRNKSRYPIIVCSSCYVTSFDNRMSLGESFLIEPERGAVCMIGTPWKTGVHDSHEFNMALFAAYKNREFSRLGDTFLQAKIATKPRNETIIDYQTFTMLGDPALRLVRTGDMPTADEKTFVATLDAPLTTDTELSRLTAHDFDVRVYRNRSLLTTATTTLKQTEVPENATHVMLVGRGSYEDGAFPRLKISMEMTANDGTTRTTTLLNTFANSLAPAPYYAPIPQSWRGRPVKVTVSVENTTYLYDERVFRLAYLAFVERDKPKE